MTQVLSLATQDMETVGAPMHHRMSLDKPFRSRGSFDLASDGRLSPSRFRAGAGRKKLSAIDTSPDGSYGMFEPLTVNTSAQVTQPASRDIICLCTPAPKIPRPRNGEYRQRIDLICPVKPHCTVLSKTWRFEPSRIRVALFTSLDVQSRDADLCSHFPLMVNLLLAFILYRQHHQSQVTAENPKLSNPEISKIIGDKWKHESEDVKDNWKKLAEEEKQRHQHQYPNYRYQPRRGIKSQGNWTGTSPTDEHGRCPKCHGRSISSPRTPSTPFSTSNAGNFVLASHSQPSLRRLDTGTPSRRSSFEQSPTGTLSFGHQLPPVRHIEQNGEPGSPETKRRRANGVGGYHAITGTPSAYTIRPPSELRRSPPESTPNMMRQYTGTALPDLVSLPRSQSGPMPPPLRPPGLGASSWVGVGVGVGDKQPASRRHSEFDESLRLPPLKTSIPPSPSKSPAFEERHLGMPLMAARVSPIGELLSKDPETKAAQNLSLDQKLGILSTVSKPLPSEGRHGPRGDERGAIIAVEGLDTASVDSVGHILEKILMANGDVALKVWTNVESGGASEENKGERDAGRALDGAEQPGVSDELLSSYFQTVLSWRQKSKQIAYHVTGGRLGGGSNLQGTGQDQNSKIVQAMSTELCTPPHDDRTFSAALRVPVALVKGGLSLTLSDSFASSMPVSDHYTAIDHWRWTANLWRWIVKPDLVVYVQEDHAGESSTAGAVDVSRRQGLIVVKVPMRRQLDEATERRLAFEVIEWMRDKPFLDEVPKTWRQNSF
uniref:MAT2 n=1 Tax=Hypocrella siamensis TaxID=696354 RepID=A0A0P0CNF9_9HYPO